MSASLSPVTSAISPASTTDSASTISQTTAFNNAVNVGQFSPTPATGGPVPTALNFIGPGSTATYPPTTPTSTGPGLTAKGSEVDTGRYIISGSVDYTSPTSGAQANDGMVSIYDKQTGTSVEVYGDPHLYTSSGDQAQFQADGLTLNLGDGTQVHFQTTPEANGVSHIQQVDISKGDQTISETGFANGGADNGGAINIWPLLQGSQAQATRAADSSSTDTVLHTGQDGSLGTLYNASGNALNDTTSQESLDGMGGATPSAATEHEIASLQQLISMLQQQTSAGQASGWNTQGMQNLTSMLQQMVTDLMSGGGTGTGNTASLVNQTLPALEQQLGQLGQSGQGMSQEASLINQAITTLMGMAGGGTAGSASSSGAGSISTTGANLAPPGSTSSAAGAANSTNPYLAGYNPATSGLNLIEQALNTGFNGGPSPDYNAYMQATNEYFHLNTTGSAQAADAQTGQNG